MKILLVIIDGLGDKPIPALNNKTPLEAAQTPNLDWLAKNGICGQILPFQFPGQKIPESDTCHLALFGYDPKIYYLGRGPYEAAGIGVNLKEGDLALRVNFATVGKNLKIIDRRAGRINETQSLIKSLNEKIISGVKFLLKKSVGHRAVLILRGKDLSEKISDGDPKKIGKIIPKVVPLISDRVLKRQELAKAQFTAKVLNEFLERTHQILKNHPLNRKREKQGKLPANYLLIRGAGKIKKIPNFYQRYKLKSGCIAGGGLYKGIAKILGMDLIKVKGANALPTTNLKGKFLAAKKALGKYDFLFLHIKAADNLAEDGNFRGKKEFIERIDRNLTPILNPVRNQRFLNGVNLKNTLIIVTADHSTCSLSKRHCSEPVPILIFGNRKDKIKEFNERVCKTGGFGKIKQLDLMPKILRLAKN